MVLDGLTESVEIKSIQFDSPGVGSYLGYGIVLEIRTDYIVFPIMFLEVGYQLGADLLYVSYTVNFICCFIKLQKYKNFFYRFN